MASKAYTAQEMREMAGEEMFKCSFVAMTLNGEIILDCTNDVQSMLEQAADALEREAAKDAEIARLRAALKPVLDCDCWIFETTRSRATDGATDAIKAVLEAQSIYNESEVTK